jgi:hypothetical protein
LAVLDISVGLSGAFSSPGRIHTGRFRGTAGHAFEAALHRSFAESSAKERIGALNSMCNERRPSPSTAGRHDSMHGRCTSKAACERSRPRMTGEGRVRPVTSS